MTSIAAQTVTLEDALFHYGMTNEAWDGLSEHTQSQLLRALEAADALSDERDHIAARCERLEAEKAALLAMVQKLVFANAMPCESDEQADLREETEQAAIIAAKELLASTTPNPLYAAVPEMLKGYELTIRDINILGQMLLGMTRKNKREVEAILGRQAGHQFIIARATRTGKEG